MIIAERSFWPVGMIHTVRVNGYDWPLERVLANGAKGWRILGSEEPEDAWLASLDVVARRIKRRIAEGRMKVVETPEAMIQAPQVRRPLCDRCKATPPIARSPDGKGLWCAGCLPPDAVPTSRAREVLELLQGERSIQEIADELGVGQATVYRDLQRIKQAGLGRIKAVPKGRPADVERNARIAAMIEEGATTADIKAATGAPKSTIMELRREIQAAADPASDPPEMQEILRLRMEGRSLSQIAEAVGLCRASVYRAVKIAARRGVVFPGDTTPTEEPAMKTPRAAASPQDASDLIKAAAEVLNLKTDDPRLLAPMIRDLRKASERIEREAQRQVEEAERALALAREEVEGLRLAVDGANAALEEERVSAGARMAALEEALQEARQRTGGPAPAEVERLRAELKDALDGAEEALASLQVERKAREDAELRRVHAVQDAARMRAHGIEREAELADAKAQVKAGLEREADLLATIQRLQDEASARLQGDLHRAVEGQYAIEPHALACLDLARSYVATDYPASSLFGPGVILQRRADDALQTALQGGADPETFRRLTAAFLALVMVQGDVEADA